jgi:hypothetical protein
MSWRHPGVLYDKTFTSLIFTGNGGAYQSGALFQDYNLNVRLLALPAKIRLGWNVSESDKLSSLSRYGITYG